jgi:hypothetical protein
MGKKKVNLEILSFHNVPTCSHKHGNIILRGIYSSSRFMHTCNISRYKGNRYINKSLQKNKIPRFEEREVSSAY